MRSYRSQERRISAPSATKDLARCGQKGHIHHNAGKVLNYWPVPVNRTALTDRSVRIYNSSYSWPPTVR